MPEQETRSDKQHTYFVDPENVAEMGRLILQDRLVTKAMGGVFPDSFDVSPIKRVLDLACGPGAWARDVVQAYPSMEVIGVDISELMTGFATSQAEEQHLQNVHFQIMNILQPLEFPDGSFDYVNARFLSTLVGINTWPRLIKEGWRVLRPGGFMRVTEMLQMPVTNSPALTRLLDLAVYSTQVSPHHLGSERLRSITPLLAGFFRQAGFDALKRRAYVIDYSAGSAAHADFYHNLMTVAKLTQPLMVSLGVATQEELETLRMRAMAEMQQEDFCALAFYFSIWGEKVASAS
ncbi:MAG: class I SAM-dependent methyltransferase [Ktedonobacteraceae bacterium]|nr:class I SAM-dependent methyltransferase [Ktedonobacteraceae bacterium]